MRCLPVISLIAVACGGGNAGHVNDAAPPIDGATGSELPPAPVTVTVTRNGQPVAGVHTYFLNPDDTVVATIDTDATGGASAVIADGGSVTVVDPFAPAQPDPSRAIELRTYAGVKAGDHLLVSQRDPAPISVTITAPTLAGKNRYDVLTTCGTATLPGSLASGTMDLDGCHGIADILVTTTPISGGSTDHFALYHPGVQVSDGGTVDLTADTFQPQRDVTFHYSHLPTGTTGVSALHGFVSQHGTLGFNDVVFDGGSGDIQDGEATFTLQVPDVENVSALIDFTVDAGLHHVVTEHLPLAASFELDATGLLLPNRTQPPHYDAANRRIAWMDAPGGAVPDLEFGSLVVTPAASATPSWTWQVAAPHTAGQLRLPALPTDVKTWVPAEGDAVSVGIVALQVPGGYDAIRDRVFDQDMDDAFEQMLGPGDRILKNEN